MLGLTDMEWEELDAVCDYASKGKTNYCRGIRDALQVMLCFVNHKDVVANLMRRLREEQKKERKHV